MLTSGIRYQIITFGLCFVRDCECLFQCGYPTVGVSTRCHHSYLGSIHLRSARIQRVKSGIGRIHLRHCSGLVDALDKYLGLKYQAFFIQELLGSIGPRQF